MNSKIKQLIPLNIKTGIIEMNHGSGGVASAQLIEHVFHRHFNNSILARGDDFAFLSLPLSQCVMSTDSFVISPMFFPGGDIGSLAVHGTVNDLAMAGYRPAYLSVSFILEEGLPLLDLDRVVASMAAAAEEAGVQIVTGDTKVVEQGKGDGIFINTTGIGVPYSDADGHLKTPSGNDAQVGDAIIVSGNMGDHGIAIMASREGLKFETNILSDSAPLNDLIKIMMQSSDNIHCLRDPTRGGLATTLNEIAHQSKVGVMLDEDAIPIHDEVNGACELLGLDPLYVANEGKLICICSASDADELLVAMRQHKYGKDAAQIGTITSDHPGMVQMRTGLGGRRLVDWLVGEPLPRIC